MDLQEIYKEESGYDVGIYNIDNTNYYSEDYVGWLEKKLRIGSVERRSEQLKCDCGETEDVKIIPICKDCYNNGEW